MVYGAYELVQQAGWPRAFGVARWFGGRDPAPRPRARADRARRRVGDRPVDAPLLVQTPLRAAVLGSALVVAVGWPALRGYGNKADNATIHPLDYGSAVLTAAGVAVGSCGARVVGVASRSARSRRSHRVRTPRSRSRFASNISNTRSWLTGSMLGSSLEPGVVVGHERDPAYGMPASRASAASGYWVMFTTSQPMRLNQRATRRGSRTAAR